jgi:hypothetical protein
MVCPREAELVNADTTKGGQPRLRLGMVADRARTGPLIPVLAIGAFVALARIAEYQQDGDADSPIGLSS